MQRKKCKFFTLKTQCIKKPCLTNTLLRGKSPVFKYLKGKIEMIDKIALILLIVGGLNWGSIGLFGFDAVAWLFGGQAALISRIIFAVVGLAALWCVSLLFRPSEAVTESGR